MRNEVTSIDIIKADILNKKILDMGCGRGTFAIEAAKYAKEVYALDIENYTASFSNTNIIFKMCDGYNTPYRDEAFDTVVFYNALIYFEKDIKGIILESLRILKPTGSIYLITDTAYERTNTYNVYSKIFKEMELDISTTSRGSISITRIYKSKRMGVGDLIKKRRADLNNE